MPVLHYRVEAANPTCHRFRVTLVISGGPAPVQRVSLAAWTPGSYMIRDFARNIVTFEARAEGRPLAVEKLDKQTWCLPGGAALEVVYEVHAFDPSVRAAYLDLQRGFFDGACMFLRVQGQEDAACEVELVRPVEPRCRDWRAATAMEPVTVDDDGYGTYRAADYEELIDHPVEFGAYRDLRWQVGGIAHRMVLAGRFQMDEARLAADLEKICATEIALFGEAPFERYLFLTNVTAAGYGGLEHRASTALACARKSLPAPGLGAADEKYREFLGLCSHEYFHAWNVKRIRPRVLQEADLSSEVYTRLLWVFEGFTSYYDELFLARSGVVSPQAYLEMLGETLTRVLRGGGRALQSVAESSFDAWTRFYKQDACAPNLIVSYYAKGALVALALDLLIRRETGHAHSLDDVMRRLWEAHGREHRGVDEDGMPALIEAATGVDVRNEVAAWVDGTEDPPLAELLAVHGVRLHLRPQAGASDRGGKRGEMIADRPVPGWRCEAEQGFAVVRQVTDGSPASEAGLAPGDLLLAVDGERARAEELDGLLLRRGLGTEVAVHFLRDDALMDTRLPLRPGPATTAWLETTDEAALRQWLGVPA